MRGYTALSTKSSRLQDQPGNAKRPQWLYFCIIYSSYTNLMEARAEQEKIPGKKDEGEEKLNKPGRGNVFRELGLGVITGAADDDPSAIGTYASAGAKFGPSFLWVAPLMFP